MKHGKVIAVVGITRAEVEAGVAHARTAAESFPIWAWCAEAAGDHAGNPIDGCDRFVPGAGALRVWKDMRGAWPALSIVAWTGSRKSAGMKLMPLSLPPFRVVAFNEARGFFAVRPAAVWKHARRRLRDRVRADAEHAGQKLHSMAYRTAERVRDFSRYAYSAVFRTAQSIRDCILLLYSLIWRGAQRIRWAGVWIWNVLLAALAAAARPSASRARFGIARIARADAPGEPVVPATGDTSVEILLSGRSWPRRAILKAVRNSDAAFVIFRQSDPAPAEPLIALARDTNAFAAARQIAWSGWRDVVLHRHPFRTLQPGEVTYVEAPHSTLTVMRRDALLRLGVPRALTSGAAFMRIYLQAAAAGLRSVAVGYGGAVTQEPAMELEDAEFVLRTPRKATLPRGDVSRGNVAWSQLHRKPFRAKPRVLIVSPYLPFPLSHGGAVRIYNLCRTMCHEVDFVLACFHESNETVLYEELHEVFREVYVVDSDEKHTDPSVPAQVAGYRNSAMAALIAQLCGNSRMDLAQLEYTQMAEYREFAGAVPVILVEHDITFTLHRQLAESDLNIGTRRQYELWLQFERQALASVNAVWTMSGRDRFVAAQNGAALQTTTAIENGADLRRFVPATKSGQGERILFVGSFRHLPNLLAFEALRDTIMPTVWQSFPLATLHVISGSHEMRFSDLDPRIVMEGFVEDVRPAYRECDVVVVPLEISAGTNIKVMEAMACGRAIVSTPLGCQGLDLSDTADLLVREPGPDFANAITLLLWDDALRARLGARARETAERLFDWNAKGREALVSYAAILDMMWDSHENPSGGDLSGKWRARRAGAAEQAAASAGYLRAAGGSASTSHLA